MINSKLASLGTFDTNKEAALSSDQAISNTTNHRQTELSTQQTTNEIQIKEEPKEDQISSNSQWL